MQKSLQAYCRVKNPQSHVLMHVPCFESVCMEKSAQNFTLVQKLKFTHTIAFQSALHDKSNTWAAAGPLKLK